jgi:hypothetical protein
MTSVQSAGCEMERGDIPAYFSDLERARSPYIVAPFMVEITQDCDPPIFRGLQIGHTCLQAKMDLPIGGKGNV